MDPDNLEDSAGKLAPLSSTGGSGGVIDAFYQDWKLALNESPKAVAVMGELWEATFAKCEKPYEHPYGPYNARESLMYIDRVCFRVPDRVSELHCTDGNKKRCLQRSLTPHIDCCPHRMFQDVGEYKYSKWRPIQAFISLTGSHNFIFLILSSIRDCNINTVLIPLKHLHRILYSINKVI